MDMYTEHTCVHMRAPTDTHSHTCVRVSVYVCACVLVCAHITARIYSGLSGTYHEGPSPKRKKRLLPSVSPPPPPAAARSLAHMPSSPPPVRASGAAEGAYTRMAVAGGGWEGGGGNGVEAKRMGRGTLERKASRSPAPQVGRKRKPQRRCCSPSAVPPVLFALSLSLSLSLSLTHTHTHCLSRARARSLSRTRALSLSLSLPLSLGPSIHRSELEGRRRAKTRLPHSSSTADRENAQLTPRP